MDRPVILCGLGRVGRRVLDTLRAAGLSVVAIDKHADPDDTRDPGIRHVRGDFLRPEVLEQAGLHGAQGVLIVTSDDLVNVSAALLVRRLDPDVRVVVRMFNPNLVDRLGKAVRNVYALSVSALAGPMLALAALTGEVLAAFDIPEGRRQVAEFALADNSRLVGRRVAAFDPAGRFLLLAHVPTGGAPRLLLDIDGDAVLAPNDRLVLCGEPHDVARLLAPSWEDLDPVLWAGRLRRFGRMLWRTLAEMDLAVKICTGILLGVILFSTLLYRYGLGQTWPDSVYHTVSVMATGADLGGRTYEGWGKFFVSFLRVAGAALLAAFTAIVTNYLIRARLGGALEVRRVPDGGHVVVCGLGNIGFRAVEELTRIGERVVVLDSDADNPFVPTCRRLGVAVIVGDATVAETLRQARTAEARAVIAATSQDLLNLEIALLAREANPKQRVVVRLGDPLLAETLREAADVRLALSVPNLAAPAFVAALLGDRVRAMFPAGGQMLSVVELAVQADDPALAGQTLRALAVDYGLVPVAVGGEDAPRGGIPTNYRLKPGDRLTAIATLADLERALRREPVPADWRVEVTGFPLTARDGLTLHVRAARGVSAEEAERVVGSVPFVLGERLTRGQAEELLGLAQRERVAARMVR